MTPFFAPAHRRTGRESSRDRAVRFLEEWGTTPFARIARFPAYEYQFVAGDRCLVPFQVHAGLALVPDRPVGPESLHPAAVSEFEARCRQRGLRPVFLPVPSEEPGGVQPFTTTGFRMTRIGSEAVLPLARFSLAGGRRKTLRQSRGRAVRRGFRFHLLAPPHDRERLGNLCRVSNAWLAARRLPEARFGVGWFDYACMASHRVAMVTDPQERVVAFASLVESYSMRETTLDLVRRDPDCDSSVIDFLFVEAILALREEGRSLFSLGLAPMARREPRSVWTRVALRALRPYYNANGLEGFKTKFRPAWRPRYVAHRSRLDLPRLAVALHRSLR